MEAGARPVCAARVKSVRTQCRHSGVDCRRVELRVESGLLRSPPPQLGREAVGPTARRVFVPKPQIHAFIGRPRHSGHPRRCPRGGPRSRPGSQLRPVATCASTRGPSSMSTYARFVLWRGASARHARRIVDHHRPLGARSGPPRARRVARRVQRVTRIACACPQAHKRATSSVSLCQRAGGCAASRRRSRGLLRSDNSPARVGSACVAEDRVDRVPIRRRRSSTASGVASRPSSVVCDDQPRTASWYAVISRTTIEVATISSSRARDDPSAPRRASASV